MKGAPGKIKEFCKKDSLPKRYLEEIKEYQSKGYRVLAYATKKLSIKTANSLQQVISLDRD